MSLIPPIKFLAFKRFTYYFKLVAVILLLSKIMLFYSWYAEKGLVYIAIIVLFSCQPSVYTECTKLNIRLSCDIRFISNAKCAFFMHFYILRSL